MTKRIIAGLFAIAVASSPAIKASAQAPFEGTMVWSMSIPQIDEEKHEMLINIKGDKSEMEMDLGVQGKIQFYMDGAKKMNYMVIQSQHMGMSMPSAPDAPASKEEEVDLKSTGKKATIAGHAAEEFTLSSEKGNVTLWASNDFPKEIRDGFLNAMAASSRGGKKQGQAFKKLAAKGMLPVKMEVKDAGETQMSMELVKLDTKKLDDALFVPPADIKFKPIPAGMGGQE